MGGQLWQWGWWVLYCNVGGVGGLSGVRERRRGKTRREETAEQTAAELVVRQQEVVQGRQQQKVAANTEATEYNNRMQKVVTVDTAVTLQLTEQKMWQQQQ